MPWLALNSFTSQSTIVLSKLSPPRCLSPAVALTSKTPSPISRTDTSNVPPPRSKIRIVWSVSLSSPYASAAAVGSLMMRFTSRPATLPASLVAWRWSSLKYAGTVITAPSTLSPRYASASVFSFCRIIALTSGGEYSLPPALTRASPFWPRMTLNGTIVSSSLTSASLRPMKRLTENTVFSGLVTAWRLATVPTRRSPPPVKATTEGVVRAPSAFSTTVGSPPSSTAMHELVVPRSMPIVLPIPCPPTEGSAAKSESECGRSVVERPPSFGRRKWKWKWVLARCCKVSARAVLDSGPMSTPQRVLTLCLAVLVAVAFGQTAADAKGLPPKQKFEVTYKAEYGQDWYAY